MLMGDHAITLESDVMWLRKHSITLVYICDRSEFG